MGTNRRFTARLLLASLCYRMVIAIAFLPASQIHAEQLNSEPLALNGSAVHTDLQLDYYYAALFSEANTPEPDELLAHKNLRMELTVLVDEWSKRRFNQYWNQSIAINNLDSNYDSHSDDLVEFSQLLKGQLIRGDRVIIEKEAEKGTRVSINGVMLMESKSEQLFSLFANIWIGPRPPSTVFKSSILGIESTINPALMTSYQSLSATGKRKDEIKGWSKPAAKKQVAKTKLIAKTVAKSVKTATVKAAVDTTAAVTKNTAATRQAATAPSPTLLDATKSEPIVSEPRNTETIVSEAIVSEPVPSKPVLSEPLLSEQETAEQIALKTAVSAPDAATSASSKTDKTVAETRLTPASIEAIADQAETFSANIAFNGDTAFSDNKADSAPGASTESATQLTSLAPEQNPSDAKTLTQADSNAQPEAEPSVAEQDSRQTLAKLEDTDQQSTATSESIDISSELLSVYHSNLLALTYQEIVYPTSAIKRNREGKVVLKVVVNRKGEVQQSSYHEESKYKALNKAASKALAKSSPFPSVPESVSGENFEFLVPINFQLAE